MSIIDDSTIVERPDAADQFLEVPDELAPGTFLGEAAAVLGENRNPRAKQSSTYYRDQRYPMHQLKDFRWITLARTGCISAQERVAALYGAPSREILSAADAWPAIAAWRVKERARIFRLEPVNQGLDVVNVLIKDIVLLTQAGGQLDMGEVEPGQTVSSATTLLATD